MRKALLQSGTWSGEHLHRTKDRRVLTIESRAELVSDGKRPLVLESTRDVTDQKKWEQRRQLLLDELSHRVSNTLAVVQSMARQTLRAAESQKEFVELFEGRLGALAQSHKLLVQGRWLGTDFAKLARSQLAGYLTGNPERVSLHGDAVALPPDLATPFGLVMHELGANAAKYGAFSTETSRVEVNWAVEERSGKRRLNFKWRECGGPRVAAPTRTGFGGQLIERSVAGATVHRDFLPDGLTCTIEIELPEEQENGAER